MVTQIGTDRAQDLGVGRLRASGLHALVDFLDQEFPRHFALELAVEPVDEASDFGPVRDGARK